MAALCFLRIIGSQNITQERDFVDSPDSGIPLFNEEYRDLVVRSISQPISITIANNHRALDDNPGLRRVA